LKRYDTTVSDIELAYAKAHTLSDNPELAGKAATIFGKSTRVRSAGSRLLHCRRRHRVELEHQLQRRRSQRRRQGHSFDEGHVRSPKLRYQRRHRPASRNTRTQEVVDIVSYQKQLVGREVKAGIFGFANGVLLDLSGGTSSMEPLHMAVRTLVERAVFEFGETLYGFDARSCLAPKAKSKFGTISHPDAWP